MVHSFNWRRELTALVVTRNRGAEQRDFLVDFRVFGGLWYSGVLFLPLELLGREPVRDKRWHRSLFLFSLNLNLPLSHGEDHSLDHWYLRSSKQK